MEKWDFKRFPELPTSKFAEFYFESPHKQINEDFFAKVVKVVDGDTIRVETDFRDFDFPVRFAFINAPEMSEGGEESKSWLEEQVMGEEVFIKVDPFNRIGKFGRIIGEIEHLGLNINQMSMNFGHSNVFGQETFK